MGYECGSYLPMPTLTMRQQRAATDRRRTRKVVLAIVGSLLLHGLLLLVLGWVLPHWPRNHLKGKPLAPLRLTLLPPTETPPAGPDAQKDQEYMRTLDEQKTEEKVKDPNFISDKDTLAASDQPATGDKPLPDQEGKKVPTFDFDTRNYRPGKEAQDAASAAQAAPAQPRTVEQKPEAPSPTATPLPKKSRPRKNPTAQATPPPDADLAAPKAEPSASPEPPAPTPEKPDTEEGNTPPPPTQRQSRNQPTVPGNPTLVPNPGLPKTPGYQPQTIQSKITGNINNRGRSAVQAIGTPMGRYIKSVQDAVGALWYYRVDEKTGVLSDEQVKINFHVDRTGKAVRVHVVDGNHNGALASVSTGSILDADIPPIPPEVASMLAGGELDMDLSFNYTIY